DLHEMAIDFSTVMNMIKTPPALPTDQGGGDPDMMEDPTVIYTNHAFEWQNRSYNDPLVAPYIPKIVAGLTGLDIGFRTYGRPNCQAPDPMGGGNQQGCAPKIAIEVEVELVDKAGDRLRKPGDDNKPLLAPTDKIVTVGVAPP